MSIRNHSFSALPSSRLVFGLILTAMISVGCLEDFDWGGNSDSAIPPKDETTQEDDACISECMEKINEVYICKEGKWQLDKTDEWDEDKDEWDEEERDRDEREEGERDEGEREEREDPCADMTEEQCQETDDCAWSEERERCYTARGEREEGEREEALVLRACAEPRGVRQAPCPHGRKGEPVGRSVPRH